VAKNVLPKHWNGSEFEELHIVTKASNVFTNDNKSVQQKIDDFTSHLADYTLQVPYAEATGTANTYSVTLNPAPTSLVNGLAVAVKIPVDSTGISTLNVNGLGAKTIKKANGSDVTNLKAGGIYTLRYDGVNFILQGEGASGNATASDLLSGKTATTDAGEITGTMPNRGAVSHSLAINGTYTIPEGYHNGSGQVTQSIPTKGAATITPGTTNQVIAAGQYLAGNQTIVGSANLVASNIKQGVNIFGVVGSLVPGLSLDPTHLKLRITKSNPQGILDFVAPSTTEDLADGAVITDLLFIVGQFNFLYYPAVLSSPSQFAIIKNDSDTVSLVNSYTVSNDVNFLVYNPHKAPITFTGGDARYIIRLIT